MTQTTRLRDHERATILMGVCTLVSQADYWAAWYAEHTPENPHGQEWVAEAKKHRAVRARLEAVLAEFAP